MIAKTIVVTTFLFLNVLAITIDRRKNGDIFEIKTKNTCHLYNAQCFEDDCLLWPCCKKCQCSGDETIFKDLCHADLGHTDLSKYKIYT